MSQYTTRQIATDLPTWEVRDARTGQILGRVYRDACPAQALFTGAEYPTRYRAICTIGATWRETESEGLGRVKQEPTPAYGGRLGSFPTAHAAATALYEAPRELLYIAYNEANVPEEYAPTEKPDLWVPVLGYVNASEHMMGVSQAIGEDLPPARLMARNGDGADDYDVVGYVFSDGLVFTTSGTSHPVVLVEPGGQPKPGVR